MTMRLEILHRPGSSRPAGPPLLFVHGSSHAAWCWDEHFLPWFAGEGFSASAVSLRGHGGSDGVDRLRWASVADYVDDVHRVAVGLTAPPILIGHSLGGLVVQKYLERHDAAGAVLMTPSPAHGMLRHGLRLVGRHPLVFLKVFLTLEPGVLFATPSRARRFLFSSATGDATVARHAARLGRESFRALLDMTFDRPRVELIGRRRCPMLILGGEVDPLVPPADVEATARAYAAPHVIFPAMGHDLMLEENWVLVARTINDWIAAFQ